MRIDIKEEINIQHAYTEKAVLIVLLRQQRKFLIDLCDKLLLILY